jgi:hypothetical protein
MAQPQSERVEKFVPFSMTAADIAAQTKKQIEEFANAQTKQLDKLRETNRLWFDRMQAEANLASKVVSKLSSARSLPETVTAYQYWGTQRIEMMAEDTKHILDDTQNWMQMSMRLFTKTWQGQRHGGGG